mgnify:CR=1 FL=1
MNRLKYLLSNSRKFHHPEVARVLYEHKKLVKLVCGSPWWKFKEKKIPKNFIDSNILINSLRYFLPNTNRLKFFHNYLNKLNVKIIDYRASKFIHDADIFLSLSKTGLKTGNLIKKQNKIYICERASSHIEFQNEILKEEYNLLGFDYLPIDQWFINRELAEYEKSDFILVPSKFVEKTFIDRKIFKSKVINFASYNDSFFPLPNLKKNYNEFNILFVGQLSIRKGLHYLIDGFKKFNHPNKKLHIAGSETEDKFFFRNLISKSDNNIHFYGPIDRKKLNLLYNIADVFVLPSIEEGQAYVTKEASSAGCPLIVTENTGASEFVNINNCGFVIPIRNSNIIADKLTLLADDNDLIKKFSKNSLQVSENYTWEEYIEELDLIVDDFIKGK